MAVTVEKSVQEFLNELTVESDASLDLREVEAAYVVYCNAVNFKPVSLVDLRRMIDATEAETSVSNLLNRDWSGLSDFLEEHQDAVSAVESEYHPDNPDRAVSGREQHVYEFVTDWKQPVTV
jgi:hypothetical protein